MNQEFYAHETAVVDQPCKVGKGTKIWHFSHIMAGAVIGENCIIGQNCFVGSRAVLGNGVKLQNNVSVYDLVKLEDYVFVGPSAVFTNDLNPRARFPKHGKWVPTLVKQGASIGANSTILCGITIGQWAMVGAGAVVLRDVPDYAIVVGCPARVVGYMCKCGQRLSFSDNRAVCEKCGRVYSMEGGRVKQIEGD